MTVSSFKKFMFVATFTSAIVAGVVGTAQAAPDSRHNFEQAHNPTPGFPVLSKPAAGNSDKTPRAVNTGMQNEAGFTKLYPPSPGSQAVKINNNGHPPDHNRWSHSGDRHFGRHHGRNIGGDFWWSPDMFGYDYGQLNQFSAETCRSTAIRLEHQHLPFSREQAILRRHGCAIGQVGWN